MADLIAQEHRCENQKRNEGGLNLNSTNQENEPEACKISGRKGNSTLQT